MAMRCFLIKKGHIRDVEFLEPAPDDGLIEQGRAFFEKRSAEGFDDFEVWDRARRIYALSEAPEGLSVRR